MLAQFEKTRQGFGGAAPNKLEVQGVVPVEREARVTGRSRGRKLVGYCWKGEIARVSFAKLKSSALRASFTKLTRADA